MPNKAFYYFYIGQTRAPKGAKFTGQSMERLLTQSWSPKCLKEAKKKNLATVIDQISGLFTDFQDSQEFNSWQSDDAHWWMQKPYYCFG
jgi:hypothetical protein